MWPLKGIHSQLGAIHGNAIDNQTAVIGQITGSGRVDSHGWLLFATAGLAQVEINGYQFRNRMALAGKYKAVFQFAGL
jgi:hypothetical protein